MTQINVNKVKGWYDPLWCLIKGPKPEPDLWANLMSRTEHFWLVTADEPLLFVGGINTSLISNDLYLWAIPFKGLHRKHLRQMREVFEHEAEAFGRVWMQVAPHERRSIRFAQFFGLEREAHSMPSLEFYGRAA